MSFEAFNSLPTSRCSAVSKSALTHYCRELLSYGPDLRALFDAADAEPDCPLLNAHAAGLHLAFEGAEGWQAAKPYLARLDADAPDLTKRERLTVKAVESWAKMDFRQSLMLFEAIASETPADLAALKWAQYHAFNLGDQAALLRLGKLAVSAFPGEPYIHGLHAFALEQSHRLGEAEREGRLAAEIALDDAWAHHAVAHVLETEGRTQDGIAWLSHCAHFWAAKGVFIREHNWWHAALFRLAAGDSAAALDIFDRHLWGEWREFPQEQIGAASMLWRLELAGGDGGARWQAVLPFASARAGEMILPFHELHYQMALLGAGAMDEAVRHLAALRARADKCEGQDEETCWAGAALPAAEGLNAFRHGDFEAAARFLEKAMPRLEKIGGSHAQRGVFTLTLKAAQARLRGISPISNAV